jgi:hypothetical protein
VTFETIPCFAAGSMIARTNGPRAVETLVAGDMVITRDDSPQPLRWIGKRAVPAIGKMVPVCIRENALGPHGELMVSPLHRVLVKDALAELMFGHPEVLIAAKGLVNDRFIRTVEGSDVEYVHLMFDRHQVVYSEGLATESFVPDPQTTTSLEDDIVEESTTIFPELNLEMGEGCRPAAQPMLRRFEAAALLNRVAYRTMTLNWIARRTQEGGVFHPDGVGCTDRARSRRRPFVAWQYLGRSSRATTKPSGQLGPLLGISSLALGAHDLS